MENMINELSPDMLHNVSGGTDEEFVKFLNFCRFQKYKGHEGPISDVMTEPEQKYLILLKYHRPGEPLPICPDPEFRLEDW